MAAVVTRVLKNKAERLVMSAAGQQWVAEKFSRDRMVNDYNHFFESLNKMC